MRKIVQHGLRGFMNKRLEGRGMLFLRLIHTTWMLWLVTVVFTAFVNPITLKIYGIWLALLVIPVAMVVALFFGYSLGGHITDLFSEELIKEVKIRGGAFKSCLLSLILFLIIIIIDWVSVSKESYGGISQYFVWSVSVIFLAVATILLVWQAQANGLFSKIKKNERIKKNV